MLETFFTPRNIAVIGASGDPTKLGYDVIRNLVDFKFPGNIYPVSKSGGEILGMKCYSSVEDLPAEVDLALAIIPAKVVPGVIRQCAEHGIQNAIVLSGGFGETDEKGQEREAELKQIANKHGVRIMGPNCIGVIDTHTPVNTTFVVGMPQQGEIGFISQSGAIIVVVMEWALNSGIGFSRIASLGNQVDVTETEMMENIGNHDQTKVVTAYTEGISDGKEFLDKARNISLKKPFIILKGGQSEKGAKAALSHTGSLSGSNDAYDAAFRKTGVLKAGSLDEMFEWARALAWQPLPRGKRVAILTNAGGFAVLTIDKLEEHGLEMAPLTGKTKSFLKSRLPAAAGINNPVDLLAGSGPNLYGLALDALLDDETVDAVIVIMVPQDWFLSSSVAEVIGEASRLHRKPIIGSIMGQNPEDDFRTIMHKRRIPNVTYPERAASILGAMVHRKEWLDMPSNRSNGIEAEFRPARSDDSSGSAESSGSADSSGSAESSDSTASTASADTTASNGYNRNNASGKTVVLPEKTETDKLIREKAWDRLAECYGIRLPRQAMTDTLEKTVRETENIGYPVVMKMVSQKFTHKSDIGGIKTNLRNEQDVRQAWNDISRASDKAGAGMEGVLLQKMLTGGQEVIVGFRQDPQFGPLVLFGTGGTEVELYRDVATAIAPLTEAEAEQLIDATIAGKKLKGWRNLPPADRKAVTDVLIRMSHIAANHPEITEMEMNPLYVMEQGGGAYAIDIRGSQEQTSPVKTENEQGH